MTSVTFDTLPEILKGKKFRDISMFYSFIMEQNIITEFGELHQDDVTPTIQVAYEQSLTKNPLSRTNI